MCSGKTVKYQKKHSSRFAWIPSAIAAVLITLSFMPLERLFGCDPGEIIQDISDFIQDVLPSVPNTPTTGDPIQVFDGAVVETAVDLEIPGISGSWTHSRTYLSKYHDANFFRA